MKKKMNIAEQEQEKRELERERELERFQGKEEHVWRENFYQDAGRARIKAGAIGAVGALLLIALLFLLSMMPAEWTEPKPVYLTAELFPKEEFSSVKDAAKSYEDLQIVSGTLLEISEPRAWDTRISDNRMVEYIYGVDGTEAGSFILPEGTDAGLEAGKDYVFFITTIRWGMGKSGLPFLTSGVGQGKMEETLINPVQGAVPMREAQVLSGLSGWKAEDTEAAHSLQITGLTRKEIIEEAYY